MNRVIAAVLLLGLVYPACAFAGTITIGTYELLPNTPDQEVEIYVTGGEALAGLNFNIQIEDGEETVSSPIFTAVDILTGTIFEGKNNGQYGTTVLPQIAMASTDTSTGATILADGLIGTATIDTTGFTYGSWALKMSDTRNGPTDFAGVAAQIADGWIHIAGVPEPSTFSFLLLFGVGILLRRRSSRN